MSVKKDKEGSGQHLSVDTVKLVHEVFTWKWHSQIKIFTKWHYGKLHQRTVFIFF